MILKRLTVAVAALFALAGSSFAAGTIPFSLSQQLDQYGKPLSGCQLYTIQAGTTSTPQNAYQDSALTIPLPNPQTCDSAGRLPQMFLADGTIKVRLTDKNGVTQVVADNIQVIGASSGSGGGTVDPTTILSTGDIKATYGTGVVSGFVRLNGRTIGSSTSGATERANSDTQSLFQYLWGADANLVVSTGRGVSAAADWAANKTIALPDFRGRVIAGLDDMGNSAAGRLTTSFGSNAIVLGSAGNSAETETLLTTNLPPYTPAGTNGTVNVTSTDGSFQLTTGTVTAPNTGGSTVPFNNGSAVHSTGSGPTFTGTAQGGTSTPFAVVQPTMLITYYAKL